MEKLHNTSTTANQSRIRSFLTAVGLVTAIVGSMVLLQDLYATGAIETSMPNPVKTSKIINADLLFNTASTIWSLK